MATSSSNRINGLRTRKTSGHDRPGCRGGAAAHAAILTCAHASAVRTLAPRAADATLPGFGANRDRKRVLRRPPTAGRALARRRLRAIVLPCTYTCRKAITRLLGWAGRQSCELHEAHTSSPAVRPLHARGEHTHRRRADDHAQGTPTRGPMATVGVDVVHRAGNVPPREWLRARSRTPREASRFAIRLQQERRPPKTGSSRRF